jgi:hypothetical protein
MFDGEYPSFFSNSKPQKLLMFHGEFLQKRQKLFFTQPFAGDFAIHFPIVSSRSPWFFPINCSQSKTATPKKRPHFQPLVQHVLELANGREQGNSGVEPYTKMGWVPEIMKTLDH